MARVETSANAVADTTSEAPVALAATTGTTLAAAPVVSMALNEQDHPTTATTTKTPTLRLFFVRHGETEANVQKIVVGQSDSPLTELGIAQAKALGQSPYWNLYTVDSACQKDTSSSIASATATPPSPPLHILPFWRIYSSDLLRTRRTTHLLLQSLAAAHWQRQQQSANATVDSANATIASTASVSPVDDPHCSGDDHSSCKVENDSVFQELTPTIRYDTRLREIAKGVRQGYPKHWTYEQALEAYQNNTANLDASSSEMSSLPTLHEESSENGWRRALDWLQELVYNVAAAAANEDANAAACAGGGGGTTTTTVPAPGVVELPHHDDCDAAAPTPALAYANTNTIYPVLVVAHAGLLRIIYQRLLGWDRLVAHKDAIINAKDERERLTVPNTSLTILDLHLSEQKQLLQEQPGAHAEYQSSGAMLPLLVDKIDIVLLTSTDHIASPIATT